MPESANKILNELNVAERNYADLDKFGLTENYKVTKEPQILFNRVRMQDIQPTIDEIVAKQKAENAPVIEFKQADLITIDDFAKIQMKVGAAIISGLYKPLAENDEEKIASYMGYFCKAYRIIGCVVAVLGLAMMPFLDFVIQDQPNIKENLYVIYLLYLFNTVITYFFSYRASLLTAAQQNYLVTGTNYIFTIVQSIFQMVF